MGCRIQGQTEKRRMKGIRSMAAQRPGKAEWTKHRLAPRCVRFGCDGVKLEFLRQGHSHQTTNGFFTIQVDGYYCPRCGGGYGG